VSTTSWTGRRFRAPSRPTQMAVDMMTKGHGYSNAKAKPELGWELRYPSWRQGLEEELA
jgi:hypothetical protein